MRAHVLAAALALVTAGCQGGDGDRTAEANVISEDPFGATGAPGSDLTDNGVNDGASGLADGDANTTSMATP